MYFTDARGRLNGRWPGKSSYIKGVGSRKKTLEREAPIARGEIPAASQQASEPRT